MTTNKQYCMCDACKDGSLHWFNCAVHNMPAAPNGPCNCGKYKPSMDNDQSAKPTERELFEAWCPCSYQQKDDDGDYDDPEADHYFEIWKSVRAPLLARIAELEAAAGKARNDALEEAASLFDDPYVEYFGEGVVDSIRALRHSDNFGISIIATPEYHEAQKAEHRRVQNLMDTKPASDI